MKFIKVAQLFSWLSNQKNGKHQEVVQWYTQEWQRSS